jgi:hypothetical protein
MCPTTPSRWCRACPSGPATVRTAQPSARGESCRGSVACISDVSARDPNGGGCFCGTLYPLSYRTQVRAGFEPATFPSEVTAACAPGALRTIVGENRLRQPDFRGRASARVRSLWAAPPRGWVKPATSAIGISAAHAPGAFPGRCRYRWSHENFGCAVGARDLFGDRAVGHLNDHVAGFHTRSICCLRTGSRTNGTARVAADAE